MARPKKFFFGPLLKKFAHHWSKTWVCGHSLAGIVGSNPTEGIDDSCECCVLSGRGLCVRLITRPDESYRV